LSCTDASSAIIMPVSDSAEWFGGTQKQVLVANLVCARGQRTHENKGYVLIHCVNTQACACPRMCAHMHVCVCVRVCVLAHIYLL